MARPLLVEKDHPLKQGLRSKRDLWTGEMLAVLFKLHVAVLSHRLDAWFNDLRNDQIDSAYLLLGERQVRRL